MRTGYGEPNVSQSDGKLFTIESEHHSATGTRWEFQIKFAALSRVRQPYWRIQQSAYGVCALIIEWLSTVHFRIQFSVSQNVVFGPSELKQTPNHCNARFREMCVFFFVDIKYYPMMKYSAYGFVTDIFFSKIKIQ